MPVTTPKPPRIIFLAHRWTLAADRRDPQATRPVAWPGGTGKLSIASNDPSGSLFGAQFDLEASIDAEHGPWTRLATLASQGSVDLDLPQTVLRLTAREVTRPMMITAVANWYPRADADAAAPFADAMTRHAA